MRIILRDAEQPITAEAEKTAHTFAAGVLARTAGVVMVDGRNMRFSATSCLVIEGILDEVYSAGTTAVLVFE